MPYQIIHDGVVREFEFFTPIGWTYWHQRAKEEDGRDGLPLVVALHGGGEQPSKFAADWMFPLLSLSGDTANWEDRFCVLYPYGFSYAPGTDGLPDRSWNSGIGGGYMNPQNDVGFIRAALEAVEKMMRDELALLGRTGRAFDVDRRFLFGYSAGGMMAYKLASAMPDQWAALWAMSSAYGGRTYAGLTQTITNPPRGSHAISLFAHHGEEDHTVPPGPLNDPSGLVVSEDAVTALTALGVVPAEDYAPSFRHLVAAAQTYRTYNNCRATAYQVLQNQIDVTGTLKSTKVVHRRDDNAANPEVIVYRDENMEHTGFTLSDDRYFHARDVWDFFKAHPRVGL